MELTEGFKKFMIYFVFFAGLGLITGFATYIDLTHIVSKSLSYAIQGLLTLPFLLWWRRWRETL